MKKLEIILTVFFLFVFSVVANAALITIGTATYSDSESDPLNNPLENTAHDYRLIYDTDRELTYLDYRNRYDDWWYHDAWASDIGTTMNVSIAPPFNDKDVDWSTGWRLPDVGENPSNGYNQTNSELGHLYYTELGNQAGGPLDNRGDFINLADLWYTYINEYNNNPNTNWVFFFRWGTQGVREKDIPCYAMAVNSGFINIPPGQLKKYSSPTPTPEPTTVLLFGTGLVCLVGAKLRKKKK